MQTFPLYPTRPSLNLDGAWDFLWLGAEIEFKTIDPSKLQYNEITTVPGVFDTFPAAPGRRGIGVYRHLIDWPADARLRLRIGGMGLAATIWWDGRLLGDYRLPYSSIDYDFNAGPGNRHELVIAVDNRYEPLSSPLFSPYFDLYGYGGIYRSIEIQELPETYLERVQVKTLKIATGKVSLKIIIGGKIPDELTFAIAFDQEKPVQFRKKIVNGEILIEQNVPSPRQWSPESPALHTVTVTIDNDRIVERFGIRTVIVANRQIQLNGKPLRLLGVNRHESHPEFGPVQSPHLMMEDLRLLKDLGCNFIRCVHYPQDQAFLDLCDQAGFLVWQESLGWNNPEADAVSPDFFALQIEQTDLMVKNSINHPSIILWGFLNECCSDTEGGKKLYGELARTIRKVDQSLLITYASNRMERDICFEFCDVAAINIYPGWCSPSPDFTTPISALIAAQVEASAKLAETGVLKDKPLLIAEIGACGLYGCHDRANAQWSEEFQADYFSVALRSVLANVRYAGIALWQFCDTRSYVNAGQVRSKPRGFNCAGLLDEYRRPKMAYDAVKAIYRAADAEND